MASFTETLPSGRVVTFREPKGKDRRDAMGALKTEDQMTLDEALSAVCLDTDAGQSPCKDFRKRYDEWSVIDMQHYQILFLELFTMDREDANEVRSRAKKLLEPTSGGTSVLEQGQSSPDTGTFSPNSSTI